MIGRLRASSDLGYVIMMVTQNTQEQKWFELATENLKSNWIYCKNVSDFCSKIERE